MIAGALKIAIFALSSSFKGSGTSLYWVYSRAISYFSSEVEQFLHQHSTGFLCIINWVQKNVMALSALLGALKV